MKAKLLWGKTLIYWQAGDLGNAYSYLGHVLHQLEDQGIPSHVHNDQHPPMNDDSLEYWFTDTDKEPSDIPSLLYTWAGQSGLTVPPGGILFPPSNDDVLAVALDPLKGAVAIVDADIVSPIASSTNLPQLFYLMYTVNQYGDFSPSDEEDGDTFEPTGWCNYNDPEIRWTNDAGQPLTDSGSLVTLANNDSDPDNNNIDGDFTLILKVGWRAAFRAAPALIDLFRRTVDAVPPVSTVEKTRADGKPLSEWNNSIVNVTLASAEDGANPGYRESGVWKRWGLCDGTVPSFAPDETPYWAISGDGEHKIQLMAMDKMGNVEGPANDFSVKVDLTPPEITFPDLRPNYLTNQNFVPLWNATDATSGIDGETAYLDGRLVVKGVSINLSLLAGKHRLEVYVYDKAGNYRYEFYDFEVWIDTQTDVKPVNLNTNTNGESMMIVVEFPVQYDVGLIDVTTCRLRVGATIDLHEKDPVMGGNATIVGELLTGVGDHDHDGIRDRMIKFDKGQFANAVAGKTGDIKAVVWGGLLPDGTPRFIGPVTVEVFTPPK